MNNFAVVEFVNEGCFETIPSEWVTPTKDHVLWPESKSYSQIRKQLKGDFNLTQGTWSSVAVRVKGYAESYALAKKLEKKEELASNCNTDVEVLSKKRKRKIRRISTDNSEEEDAHIRKQIHNNLSKCPTLNDTKTTSSSRNSENLDESLEIEKQSCLELHDYGGLSDSGNEMKTQLETNQDILKKILKIVEKNASEIKLVKQEINKLNTAVSNLSPCSAKGSILPNVELNFLPIPVTSTEDLLKVEAFLNNPQNFSKMVQLLTNLGGDGDVKNTVYNCMKKVFGSQYSRQYSLLGRKGKLAFSQLKLHKCVLNAVQILTSSGEEDVNKRIGVYLSGAGDRFGGRRKRKSNISAS